MIKVKIDHINTQIMYIFKTLVHIFKLSPYLLIVSFICKLVLSLIPPIQLLLTKNLFDSLATTFNFGNENLGNSIILLSFQFAIMLLSSFIRSYEHLISSKLEQNAKYKIDSLILKKASLLPLTFFDNSNNHDHLRLSFSSSRSVQVVLTLFKMLQNIITFVGYLAVLININLILGLGFLILLIPIFTINLIIGKNRYSQIIHQTPSDRKVNYLEELLTSREAAKEIRVYGISEYLIGSWKNIYWKNVSEKLSLEISSTKKNIVAELFSTIILISMSSFLLFLGVSGKITLGTFIAVFQTILITQGMLQSIAIDFSRLYESSLHLSHYFNFLKIPDLNESDKTLELPEKLVTGINVKNLSFSYKTDLILNNINLSIKAGQKVAIVGENGAGKTSLIKCLLGLYQPTTGDIYYDNVNLKNISSDNIRKKVTVAFQDYLHYQLSIRENIAFGKIENINDNNSIEIAATKAGIHKYFSTLTDGYETNLSPMFPGGQDLSGGQWQKVALSRVYLKNADVVFFDEPTAALDPLAEATVFDELLKLSEGKTSIIISHRLGVCSQVDYIYVLKNGCLVEEGTHNYLLGLNGEYTNMYQSQAKWYNEMHENISRGD
ncbi:ABC transporter ATP-binding protein [Paenibacillus marinisediminis]